MKKHTLLLLLVALGFSNSSFATIDPTNSATRSYKDVKSIIEKLAADHPANASIFELGIGDTGEMIEGLKIGNGPVSNLVVGTHHGNEYGATEVALAVAESLALAPIQGQTVFVLPVLNISGYNAKERRETKGSETFDPNRNYPGPCGTEGPFTLKSTTALATFIDKQNIVTSATLHTFYPAVVYPWGLASQDLSTHYDDQFKDLVKAATVESGYATGNSTQVIYAANGTYEDFAFWQHGIWSILFELGDTHTPSPDQVTAMVQTNVPGIRRMLEQAPRVRAEKHAFEGKCDGSTRTTDKHDE